MFETAKSWLKGPGRRQVGPSEPERSAHAFIEDRLGSGRPAAKPAPPVDKTPSIETRNSERFVPLTTMTYLTVTGGKRYNARIINISQQAVAVEAEFTQIDPAAVTKVGAQPVKLGRAIRRGMVFRFDKPLDPALCGPNLIL